MRIFHHLGLYVPWLLPVVVFTAAAESPGHVWQIDGFDRGFDLKAWQSSESPDYYRGGTGQKGIEVVRDPERGQVLRCAFRFSDAAASEPVFFTRKLDPQPPRMNVRAVRFKAKLTAPLIAPRGGFILRLRTSDTQHDNWDVQKELGHAFPVNTWVSVEIPTRVGPDVRNVWKRVFGNVRQMTFRLDDIDGLNGEGALLLDDIEMVLDAPAGETAYVPVVSARPVNPVPKILIMMHRAAGFYGLEDAIHAVVPGADVTTLPYRGLHFELFGFPSTRREVLAYDAIIMLDIDPFVLSRPQAEWVADAVASGSGLLLFGGSVTLTQSKNFRQPLRAVLPVRFSSGAAVLAGGRPEPGPSHPLNRGFDPKGLGLAGPMQALTPIDGAAVPWHVGDQPLVIAASVGRGRSVVVNTQLDIHRCRGGDWFTSTLSDDLMRQLISWTLGRVPHRDFTRLVVPEPVIGSGTAHLEAAATPGQDTRIRVLVGKEKRPVKTTQRPDGTVTADIDVPATMACESLLPVRLELHRGGVLLAWRDLDIPVWNPLDLRATWAYAQSTFAPGRMVDLDVSILPRGLPRVQVGSGVEARFAGDWSLGVSSFADVWVYCDGAVYHDQGGPADVVVTSTKSLPPTWNVRGILRATRPAEGTSLGLDGRLAEVERTVTVALDGAVDIITAYTFLTAAKIQRLPLTVNLPVNRFAGLPYEVIREDGSRVAGIFPRKPQKGKLFDGTGCRLRIETPRGPLELQVMSPGRRVWARDLRQYKMTSFRLEIEAPCNEQEVAVGDRYETVVRLRGPGTPASHLASLENVTLEARLVDPESDVIWPIPAVSGGALERRFRGRLPNLVSGDYVVELAARADGSIVARRSLSAVVVDPLDRRWFYPIMSIIGMQADGHSLDPEGIRGRVDDLVAHGFNTAALTGVSSFLSTAPSASTLLKARAEQIALQRGMAASFEYTNYTTYRRNRPLHPCPFSSDLEREVADYLDQRIELGNRTPRLLTAKVVDEPTMRLKNLDRCAACRAAFRERYGFELGEVSDDAPPFQRWALADFLGVALERVFAAGADAMRAKQARFDLLLTYMATGLGYQHPRKSRQDALGWSRTVTWADFDIYPYFYPKSQRLRMVQAGFGLSAMKDIGRARGIRWGFYVELDDRNWPFQKNPARASAECAYTAVAHGADYLNTFIHRVVGTGTQARPERWEEAGKAFRLIRTCGPLLTVMPAIRAPLAVFFPEAQEFIENGYERPQYTLAMLKGTYGEVDIHWEGVVDETGVIPYAGLLLLRTRYLHEKTVPILRSWLEEGGVLFTDHLPESTHRGKAISWGIEAGEPLPFHCGTRTLHVRPARVGQGTVVFLQEDVETLFEEAVEAHPAANPDDIWDLRQAFGQILGAFAPPPTVRVGYRENQQSVDTVEAGLRGNRDAILLSVVSHRPETLMADVDVARPDIRWLVDMRTMKPLTPAARLKDGFRLRLSVPRRGARLIAGYRRPPRALRLGVDHDTVPPGGTLVYSVTVKGGMFSTVPGGVLVRTRVTDPHGRVISRFSKAMAPVSGQVDIPCAIPLNAMPGRYHIETRLPQTGAHTGVDFTIQAATP